MKYDIILVRFGEMTLKKKNYKQFLDRIIQISDISMPTTELAEACYTFLSKIIAVNSDNINEFFSYIDKPLIF